MKKIAIFTISVLLFFSCKNEKQNDKQTEEKTETSKENKATETTTNQTTTNDINWDEIPDLKNIGNFPFITAPNGLKINNEKNGVTEMFEYETMENYTGNAVYTTEGKLGILSFDGESGNDFNQKLFNKSIYDYVDKVAAKKLYQGNFPTNENDKAKLEKNLWSGKHGSYGLIRESDAPFAVYAFKNNQKKYVLNIQSNSARGNIFIMQLKDFEQTIKKYTAEEIKTEIDKTGKAILNINFDVDKATITPEAQKIVDEIFVLLNTNTNLKISIEGHTDNTGNPAANKQLSIDRANAIMNALINNKIDKNRLKSTGFGAEKPLNANDSEENKAKNRRVELVKF